MSRAVSSKLPPHVASAIMRPAILIVDDDAASRRLIGEIFRRDQMDVSFAESGEGAMRLLESPQEAFDLVLLDRMMAGIDGLEVLRRIKSIPRLASLPVVVQTGASAPDQVSEGLAAGAFYYLTKPYVPDALRTIVRAALADLRHRRELEQRADATVAAFELLQRGQFVCRALEEAHGLAALVAQLAAEPRVAVLGLGELIANAIEHGNLGIDFAQKSLLLRQDRWSAEVRRRAALPENRDKRVRVEVERQTDELRVSVSDEGVGFDYARYLDLDPTRAFEPNGRGIALARLMSFKSLSYLGNGNTAVATLKPRLR